MSLGGVVLTDTRAVNPAKLVLVQRGDHWLDGQLRGWRRDVDGWWLGYVCYLESPGIRYLEWVASERVRGV